MSVPTGASINPLSKDFNIVLPVFVFVAKIFLAKTDVLWYSVSVTAKTIKEPNMNPIGSIIAENRKKKRMTQPVLAEKLAQNGIEISYKTISGWEKGLSEPPIGAFIEICRILEIPDIYEALYGSNPFNRASLLNDEGKEKLNEYTELLISSNKYEKEKDVAKIIPFVPRRLKIFDTKVSAGTGNFLDSDSYSWKEVGEEVPKNADFGVQISGDSMEPQYKDKQIVWIHQQSSLNNGDIGIFCFNGNAFCKKLQEDGESIFLISLNEKYAPINVTEHDDLIIFGKVLN